MKQLGELIVDLHNNLTSTLSELHGTLQRIETHLSEKQ
jgi:hypothetical protein